MRLNRILIEACTRLRLSGPAREEVDCHAKTHNKDKTKRKKPQIRVAARFSPVRKNYTAA